MKHKFLLLLLLTSLFSGPAFSIDLKGDYEEMTYDQLLGEMQSKKRIIIQQIKSPFDDVKIHAGMGYINSVSQLLVRNQSMQRYQNGLQLMAGIDLFTKDIYAEGIFRNFGVTHSGNEAITLRELDFKLGYKKLISNMWTYKISTGLANRYINFENKLERWSQDSITPSFLGAMGMSAKLSSNLYFTVEASGRSALVSNTIDKNSLDLTLQLQTEL